MIPFIEAEAENVTSDDVVVSLCWQQKRLLLTGEHAGGNHIITYGMVENRGNDCLKAIRFLYPGEIIYARDLSVDAWVYGKGPAPRWKITKLEKVSSIQGTTLSVLIPYPQSYLYIKGHRKPRNLIGTVRENKITVSYPPSPLIRGDLRFREILKKSDLVFTDRIVETADRKLWIQLWRLNTTELIQELNLEPGEARFFAHEIYIPDSVIMQSMDSSKWDAHGPLGLLSMLSTEINQLRCSMRELDASSESIDRFQKLVTRLKTGRCEVEEYWLSVFFSDGQYASTENTPPVATYLHEDRTYVAKTWIFKDEEMDFYVVITIYPAGTRLAKVIESVPLDQGNVDEKSEKGFEYFDRQFRMLGLKINGVNSLIQTLRQEVVTKEDLQRTERILVENQKIIQELLKEKINELRPEIEIEIEQKIGNNEASRFWRILERLSTIGGVIEFAKCVKELVNFLNEHKIVQTVLPLLVGLLVK